MLTTYSTFCGSTAHAHRLDLVGGPGMALVDYFQLCNEGQQQGLEKE